MRKPRTYRNCLQTLLYLTITIFFACHSKVKVDAEKLAIELDSIMLLDQKYRAQMQGVKQEYGWNSPEMREIWKKQNEIDQSNLKRILEIIKEVGGYPGKSLVGFSASKTTFYVLQHAPDSVQGEYYDLIVEAAEKGELNKNLAAMYQDRYLMHHGEPQTFGTQVKTEYETDSITGERIEKTFVWPIADTANIDSLRMWNGMGPLEPYLNNFGISRWE